MTMGYRSTVAIAMFTKDYEAMIKQAEQIEDDKLKENVLSLLDKKSGPDNFYNNGKYTVLQYDSIKWYDEGYGAYDEIIWIKNNMPNPHAFIRIGEELDDNEIEYKELDDNGEEHNEFGELIMLDRNVVVNI
jgi:hypothetical protein